MTSHNPTILVVDDEEAWIDLIKLQLEKHGIDAICETNPEKVLSEYDIEDPTSFDCILSDNSMPQMTGKELLERVRDKNKDIPFIFYTSKRKSELKDKLNKDKSAEYMQKNHGEAHYTSLCDKIEESLY